MSNILVIGSTGMVGSRTVNEAVRRGHTVTAASRSGKPVDGASRAIAIELGDTDAVAKLIEALETDVTIIAVSPDRTGGSTQPLVNAHTKLIDRGVTGRVLIVGGAGSLQREDGSLLVDSPEFPEEYKAEAQAFVEILNLYRNSDLTWTMLSPSPAIAPGERTGNITLGTDSPVGGAVSAENFAVAMIDEVENPQHVGTRFTVADAKTSQLVQWRWVFAEFINRDGTFLDGNTIVVILRDLAFLVPDGDEVECLPVIGHALRAADAHTWEVGAGLVTMLVAHFHTPVVGAHTFFWVVVGTHLQVVLRLIAVICAFVVFLHQPSIDRGENSLNVIGGEAVRQLTSVHFIAPTMEHAVFIAGGSDNHVAALAVQISI